MISFENIMTLICHLANRDEVAENEIIRKNEGMGLLKSLWDYRNERLALWLKFNRTKYPLIGSKPGFLYLLKDELSPDQNWALIWQDEKIKKWLDATRKPYLIECAFAEKFERPFDI